MPPSKISQRQENTLSRYWTGLTSKLAKHTHTTSKKTFLVWFTLAATPFSTSASQTDCNHAKTGCGDPEKELAQKRENSGICQKNLKTMSEIPQSVNNLQEAPPFWKNSDIRKTGSTLDTNNMKKDHGQPFSPKRPVGTRSTADFRQKRSWTMVSSPPPSSLQKSLKYALAPPLDMFVGVIFLAWNLLEVGGAAVIEFCKKNFAKFLIVS